MEWRDVAGGLDVLAEGLSAASANAITSVEGACIPRSSSKAQRQADRLVQLELATIYQPAECVADGAPYRLRCCPGEIRTDWRPDTLQGQHRVEAAITFDCYRDPICSKRRAGEANARLPLL